MAAFDEVVGDHAPGEPVVAGHRRMPVGAAHDEDVWQSERRYPVGVGRVAVGVGDQQPVDAPRAEQLDPLPLCGGVVVGERDQHIEAALKALAVDRFEDRCLRDVGQRVGGHPDHAAAAAAQPGGERVWPEAKFGGRSVDARRRFVAGWRAPQCAGDGGDVQSRPLGERAERRTGASWAVAGGTDAHEIAASQTARHRAPSHGKRLRKGLSVGP
ncbi:MAG: hypothetical protein QM679_08100 [Patulibacter sp.]